MAKVKGPISQDIVRGFKGVLIYYQRKDMPSNKWCVRSWPSHYRIPMDERSVFCRQVKHDCHEVVKDIPQKIRDYYKQNTAGSDFTWQDFLMSQCMKAYYQTGELPAYLKDFSWNFESPQLHITYTLSREVIHKIARHKAGQKFPVRHRVETSYLAGCDVPIEQEPDCEDEPCPGSGEAEMEVVQLQERRGDADAGTYEEAYSKAMQDFFENEWEISTYMPSVWVRGQKVEGIRYYSAVCMRAKPSADLRAYDPNEYRAEVWFRTLANGEWNAHGSGYKKNDWNKYPESPIVGSIWTGNQWIPPINTPPNWNKGFPPDEPFLKGWQIVGIKTHLLTLSEWSCEKTLSCLYNIPHYLRILGADPTVPIVSPYILIK